MSKFVAFLKRIAQIVFLVGFILIVGPVFLRQITGVEIEPVSETTIDSPGAVKQTIVAEIEAIENFACAEYNGVVFLRETIPASFVGIDVYDVDIWKHIPGRVRASIYLKDYDLQSNVSIRSDSVFICLPAPKIDTCELLYDEIVEGISSISTPIESAADLGMIEDAMYAEAEILLIEKAWEAGIMQVAENQARQNTEAVIHTICGNTVIAVVSFQ